jgi:hypothetical protein
MTLEWLLQNIVFDRARREMLALFQRRLSFSFKHLRFVGDEFSRELFGAAPVTLMVTGEGTVKLLSRVVHLRSIRIEQCRAESFLVLGEDSEVLRTALPPRTLDLYSCRLDSNFITRFLLLFFATAESIACV